ncbi:class II glutamine amidotransferase [Kiritimatiella glycovorans]|uniref:Amidophosphoribosyltransferase n=1 Tax=Kiritimatiella glycovorans TaxID=1307763 RepID=A0A0G3EFD2_9BACT|nr:class II glutamine amidotransferase [Kiritimatiella glycovorans]AKJ64137.1 Amidophosphoribosyltransferase precursor [Kiritimatiella glycovorans]
MSEHIGHECGIAAIRLLKPLDYYIHKYGTALYAVNKLYLLMEKQRNRGQDGAGAAALKLGMHPGDAYFARVRSTEADPSTRVYEQMRAPFDEFEREDSGGERTVEELKRHAPFAAEILMGHLRYATRGKGGPEYCHPFLRENNWQTRNLAVAGNFNLTNNDELFRLLTDLGQHPPSHTDTEMMLEKIGHFLDEANERLFRRYRRQNLSGPRISGRIAAELDMGDVLRAALRDFDGGYVITGLVGHGELFVARDPQGIRPVFYYRDEEALVVASERPAIQTAFSARLDEVAELEPGHAMLVDRSGTVRIERVAEPAERAPCSFERIYFSRGTDADIYHERKKLGARLCDPILGAIGGDFEHTVFSYIPNTAETAFLGLSDEMRRRYLQRLRDRLSNGEAHTEDRLDAVFSTPPRFEKIMTKDAKLRTFIASGKERKGMVALAYDTTYGVVRRGEDTLVVLDDSIVRGTTLRESILRILDRIGPKKILVVSSAPQIRYPDCYGIDMSKLRDFVAFEAAVALLHERGMAERLDEVYAACRESEARPRTEAVNHVKRIYEPFTAEDISGRIAQMLRPEDMNAELQIIYQTIEDLHQACPSHRGDWYFTGHYPTPGGNRVANRAFMHYVEKRDERAY